MSDLNTEVAQDSVQNEEVIENEIVENQVESEQETNNSEIEESEKPAEFDPEVQKKVGKLLKAERERERRRVEAEWQSRLSQMNQQPIQQQAVEQGPVFDPMTGEYYDPNSAVGQQLLREQKIQARQAHVKAAQEHQKLGEKIRSGMTRFEDYDETSQRFMSIGTDLMAEVLKGAKDPAAVIHYLGSHPEELERIAKLSPAEQVYETAAVDLKVNPAKKLVSNASKPVNTVNEAKSPVSRYENLSFKDKSDIWRKKINER